MPYGLNNAPSFFQSFVDEIFRDLHGQGEVVYIDDILIYSATRAENVSMVRKVLGRLYVKAEKYLSTVRLLPRASYFHVRSGDGE